VNDEDMEVENECLDEFFVTTTDFQLSVSHNDVKNAGVTAISKLQKKQTKASPKGLKQPQNVSPLKAEKPSSNNVPANFNKQSNPKLSKRSKSINGIVDTDGKKSTSGSTQSKSLVNIVKSKFSRNSASAKLSPVSKKNQLEASRYDAK